MKIITELDYLVLENIPVYPEEITRGEIVRRIKDKYPEKYKNLTTSAFDAILLKYSYLFPLIEDKNIPETIFFESLYDDADCLQSTLEELPLDWVKSRIGSPIDVEDDDVYLELVGLRKPKRAKGWYKQSDFHLG
ncbi:MAG TPA: hypothetical protein VFC79_01405 [Tissierellaceae bacterium]|nr:hypothetical protein [Tissierellaceae bacterium]